MSSWTGERVARVLGAGPAPDVEFTTIGIDTRTLASGALFVALAGERFDGHAFLADAAARGARGAVVRRATPAVAGLILFEVDDPLAALGALARDRREQLTGPVVAITGTNGKTATKEMLARALATRYRVHATQGNLNNLVGVPLTILAAPPETEALAVEAGASVPGEIARLRSVIGPSAGIVTNVAAGHTEGFGSLAGVLAEKVELVRDVPLAVVGTDPPELARRAQRLARRVLIAGSAPAAEVRPDAWSLDRDGRVRLRFRRVDVRLPLVGRHQVENAALALATAAELGVDLAVAAAALADVALPPGRCEVLRCGRLVVLNDAYNANPASLAASLDTARAMRRGRPLVVLVGTMLELGHQSAALHAEMAARILECDPALVGAVGGFVPAFEPYRATLGHRLLTADDPATLGRSVAGRLHGDELVLLKASRGVRLEQAIPYLLPDGEDPCSSTS